jgi:transposase-like protein
MDRTHLSVQEKEAIIAEYLLGSTSYRSLGKKYRIDFRLIHSWVMKFQGKAIRKSTSISKKNNVLVEQLPAEVKLLQEELRKAKLHNELLTTMIDIAEKQLNISIRKKSGTK